MGDNATDWGEDQYQGRKRYGGAFLHIAMRSLDEEKRWNAS